MSQLPDVVAPPSPAEWSSLTEQAQVIASSGLAPRNVASREKVLTIALKGRELRIPPMQALNHIHVVEGKPTLSAELMVALCQRAGHKVRVVETSNERATVEGIRSDDPEYRPQVTFTWDDAKQAGVVEKDNWKRHPAAMLRARAISALCRMAFADVLMGASYTPEELGEDVDVGEDGSVVTVTASSEPSEPQADDEIDDLLAQLAENGVEIDRGPIYEHARHSTAHRQAIVDTLRKRLDGLSDDGQNAETSTSDVQAPFDAVSDEQLAQLTHVISQLPKPADEQARLLQEADVGELGELSAQQADHHIDRLTKRLADKQAREAAATSQEAAE